MHGLTDKKSIRCYAKYRERFVIKNGLLYYKDKYSKTKEDNWRFVVPHAHHTAALNGCHSEAAHQGQRRSQDLAIECFWWPGMCRSIVNLVKGCACCIQYESAAPIAPMKPLTCSGPGELVHMDFVSVEESMRLRPVRFTKLHATDWQGTFLMAHSMLNCSVNHAANPRKMEISLGFQNIGFPVV